MSSKTEYVEGPQAREKFEAAMKTIFKASKKKKQPKAATSGKPSERDRN